MKHFSLVLAVLLVFPTLAFAAEDLQTILMAIIGFVNNVLIPFILGIGFLFFVWNAIRYFVIEGSSEDGRENAKNLAIYSVAAFVIIVIFWGIVNLLAESIFSGRGAAQTPDYLEDKGENWTNPLPTTTDI